MADGVFSDTDIRTAIQRRALIEDPDGVDRTQPSCYDLTVGQIVTSSDIIIPQSIPSADLPAPSYSLKPGEVATIFSAQKINMPQDVTALLIPKNEPAARGLLMLNLGHVEPGWNGNVTVQVVNLNESAYALTIGDPLFSIVFYHLSSRASNPKQGSEPLGVRLAKIRTSMSHRQSFLTMDAIREKFIDRDRFDIEFSRHLRPPLLVALTLAGIFIAAVGLGMGYAQCRIGLAGLERTPVAGNATPNPVPAVPPSAQPSSPAPPISAP